MFNLAALDFVVVEVHIIEELVGKGFRHVASITSSYDCDGGKFAGCFVCCEVIYVRNDDRQKLKQDVAVTEELWEVCIFRQICIEHLLLVFTKLKEIILLCYLPLQ